MKWDEVMLHITWLISKFEIIVGTNNGLKIYMAWPGSSKTKDVTLSRKFQNYIGDKLDFLLFVVLKVLYEYKRGLQLNY